MEEYGLSKGAMKAVWLQYGSNLWSLAAFIRTAWRVFSAILTVVNVEEYGKSMAKV